MKSNDRSGDANRNLGDTDSLDSLRTRARKLSIFGADKMSRDELLYEIGKAEGGDGSLGV